MAKKDITDILTTPVTLIKRVSVSIGYKMVASHLIYPCDHFLGCP